MQHLFPFLFTHNCIQYCDKGLSHICQKSFRLSPRLNSLQLFKLFSGLTELIARYMSHFIWCKQNFIKRTPYQQSNMVRVMWWFGASGPGKLPITGGTMTSVPPSLGLQQDNDLKHTSKSYSEWLRKQTKLRFWSGQVEVAKDDPKQAVCTCEPSNLAEWK